MTKTEKATVSAHLDAAEAPLRKSLAVLKAKPRAGKDLEALSMIEAAVQEIENVRASGFLS